MDKYEYKIKAEQIKKLVGEENYLSAMKIADTIDWRRVKNVSMLCQISDIYEKNGKYEESHELLLLAYDRSPIGRMMVYKLAELAIKMGDYEEAIDYYREFVHLSPGDSAADILKYKIYKAKGATASELIPILEAFKQKEYHEEWAYELATLYHEAGMADRCVEECDDIILWFSEGKFVERAMELKMLYKPLSKEQQLKYNHRNEINGDPEDGYLDEDDEETEEKPQGVDTSKVVVMTEDMFNDSIDAMDIKIKPVNLGKYDTINLQAELAKSMEQIMSATEKETVDTTMDNIRRLVEDSQILDINFDDELENSEIKFNSIEFEVPPDLNMSAQNSYAPELHNNAAYNNVTNNNAAYNTSAYNKVLAEESDGQISICMPENNILEKQITGQMRIEDVLYEWEKMKEAAQSAIKEAEQKRLNEAKSKALQKAENIMSKLALIISEEELKNNGKEIAAALEASFLEDDSINEIAASLEDTVQEQADEGALDDEVLAGLTDDNQTVQQNDFDLSDLEDTISSQTIQSVKAFEDEKIKQEIKKQYTAEIIASEVLAQLEEQDEEFINSEDEDDTAEYDDSAARALEDRITSDLPHGLEAIIAKELEGFEDEIDEEYTSFSSGSTLTKEQQEIFAAFLSVRGVEKALEKMFSTINSSNSNDIPFEIGDVIVIGDDNTGKTTLGMAIAKAVQIAQRKKSGKVAKITGKSLNNKDIKMMADRMAGGVLIIEKAGSLREKTIKNIMEALQETKEEVMLIIEDSKTGIESVLSKDKDFASRFSTTIELPEYNNDELVEFGRDYAKTLMYSFDDMAVLAFYTCLGNIQKDDTPITIDQVKEIVDKAIAKSNKKKLKKLKDIIMSRRYDDERRVILQECDFEDIV